MPFYVIGLSENNNRRLHKCILKCLSLPVLENIWKKNYTKNIFRLLKSLRFDPERLFFNLNFSFNLPYSGFDFKGFNSYIFNRHPTPRPSMKNLMLCSSIGKWVAEKNIGTDLKAVVPSERQRGRRRTARPLVALWPRFIKGWWRFFYREIHKRMIKVVLQRDL